MTILQPLSACAHPPPISISLQERGEPPLLHSTVRAYIPLISDLHLWQGVPFCQLSAHPAPLYHLSALSIQQGVPPLQPLAMCNPPPPKLPISLQGLGVSLLLLLAVRAYSPLLW